MSVDLAVLGPPRVWAASRLGPRPRRLPHDASVLSTRYLGGRSAFARVCGQLVGGPHIDPILTVDAVGEGPLSGEISSCGWATPYSGVGESEEKGRGVYRGTCLGMSSLPHRSWKQCGTGNFLVAIGGAVLSTEGCVSGLAVEVMRRVIGDQSGRLLRREV